MIQVDLRSRVPIYEQVYENVRRLILQGILEEDDQLPSVRELATTMTINPNTVQKAFKSLEKDGYIYSINGRGNFVNRLSKELRDKEQGVVLDSVEDVIEEARLLKIPKDQLLSIIDRFYEEEQDDEHR